MQITIALKKLLSTLLLVLGLFLSIYMVSCGYDDGVGSQSNVNGNMNNNGNGNRGY
jgi:hypothetical protein